MDLTLFNNNNLEQFCKSNDRISSYKNSICMIKNAYCVDYKLYLRFNDGLYKQEFKKNQVIGTNKINLMDKDDIDFTKIKEYNRCMYISQVFYNNFLHFIIDLFIDYLFYLEVKTFIPNLKFCCHFKNEFIDRVKKFGLDKLFNIKSDMDKDLYDGNYTNQHYNIFIFSYRDIMDLRKEIKFTIYNKNYNYIENFMNTYHNPSIQPRKYIYISRRQRDEKSTIADHNRSLVNENELIGIIGKYNFEEVFMEDYDSIIDKLYILKNAEIIIVQSSATCILLGMIDLKNIIVIGGPYRLTIFPRNHKNKLQSIKTFFSDDIKIKNKGANVPWELSADNLFDMENYIRSLQLTSI